MLAYPLAMLYVFEWLGYQEVSLPMKRENPVAFMQFSDQRSYMVVAMIATVACMIVSMHVERSRFGRSLLAIKQNLPAAEAAGINAARWRMYAMMISAAMAALAGGIVFAFSTWQVAWLQLPTFLATFAVVSPPKAAAPARTGTAANYAEFTLGAIYKPKPYLWIRPEARYDWIPDDQWQRR